MPNETTKSLPMLLSCSLIVLIMFSTLNTGVLSLTSATYTVMFSVALFDPPIALEVEEEWMCEYVSSLVGRYRNVVSP